MSKRTYKIQNFGGSHYLCIPSTIITENMLKFGVKVKIIHNDIGKDEAVILIRADIIGEHNKSSGASGKDT